MTCQINPRRDSKESPSHPFIYLRHGVDPFFASMESAFCVSSENSVSSVTIHVTQKGCTEEILLLDSE